MDVLASALCCSIPPAGTQQPRVLQVRLDLAADEQGGEQ